MLTTVSPVRVAPSFIEVDTKLAFTRQGAGAPVICLHATGHGARDFDALAQRLGDRFEFIALDWPGQGGSPRDHEPACAVRYASLLAQAANALGVERPIILGNSIGGAAAILYAAENPDRIRGVVLCNPGGLQPANLLGSMICGNMARKFAAGVRGEARFGRWFKRYYEREILPQDASAWRRAEIIAGGYDAAPVLQEAWESFSRPEADIRALIPRLTMPVLYAWAKRDALIAWSRCKRAALAAPNCEVALFDAGHCAFLEQPEAFDRAFLAFAARLKT